MVGLNSENKFEFDLIFDQEIKKFRYKRIKMSTPPPACPMHKKEETKNVDASKCPMSKAELGMNPANNMPYLPNRRLNENEEKLSTEREISSIPMSVEGNNGNINRWEYPSPQQFYNALLRKGMETPVEHIDTMVDIHNFLNEGAWNEVLKWEKLSNCDCSDPKLLRFSGRPKEMSPKAWFYTTFFGAPKPFDRHDWIVDRCGKEVRYVIDYYAGDENPHEDAPEFVLDVRPAIDSLGAIKSRLAVAFTEFFQRFNNSS